MVSSALALEEAKGKVDWVNGYVVAIGHGTAPNGQHKAKAKLNARRAAEASAQRALMEIIQGVQVNSNTTVKNMMLEQDIINTRVEGFLKGAVITSVKEEEVEGSPVFTVEMKACLTGEGEHCGSKNLATVVEADKIPQPPFVPETQFPMTPPQPVADVPPPAMPAVGGYRPPECDRAKPVTGVIFNLDGRSFQRQLLPVVVADSEGSLATVYSAKVVTPNVIRTYGAVRYSDTLDQAKGIQAIGGNPLIVYVDTITPENMIVIRTGDAGYLRETMSHGNNYLSEAKVVITAR